MLAAQRLHGDDTPVPVLAKGKTDTARAWVYVRDDTPFAGQDPPAALFAELPHTRVHELLPWNWKAARDKSLAA